MDFSQINIEVIPMEAAHGGSGSRKILVNSGNLPGKTFEALTKGYLEPGKTYDWHNHQDINEIFIVIRGNGKFSTRKKTVNYVPGDVFTIPANLEHKIEAEGESSNEFYFFRFKI